MCVHTTVNICAAQYSMEQSSEHPSHPPDNQSSDTVCCRGWELRPTNDYLKHERNLELAQSNIQFADTHLCLAFLHQ